MSRLVIDVSGEQHQQIKSMAAIHGKSIKEFVLERLFNDDEQGAWGELESILLSRIEQAERGKISDKPLKKLTEERLQARKS
jgi:ubiquitin C-terminal hydrolase